MKRCLAFLIALPLVATAFAGVHVFVQSSNSVAWVNYECTAGEVVRAFALDISVERGRIIGISDYFRGLSTAENQGYGIFPASFRDNITTGPGTNINWNGSGYTPLAVMADNPVDTLAGLNSSGVTLEFGGLWDPNVPAAVPRPTGTLCSLHISAGTTLTVKANLSRGGLTSAEPGVILAPVFTGAFVQPPEITNLSLTNELLTVWFAGGELETAFTAAGPWTGTGEFDGQLTDSVGDNAQKFYRVRGP
jgi:hypothetical protein